MSRLSRAEISRRRFLQASAAALAEFVGILCVVASSWNVRS